MPNTPAETKPALHKHPVEEKPQVCKFVSDGVYEYVDAEEEK